MTYEHINTEQLAKKIRTRKEFLNLIVKQAIDLVGKYGKVTKRDQGSCHTNIVRELRNFGSFTFETDFGQTCFGGNGVRIWYHPKRIFREGGLDSAFDKEWTPVLDVYYQEQSIYEVTTFKESPDWQKALQRVFKNKIKIAVQIAKDQEKAKKALVDWKQNDTKKANLLADAQKLGIIPRMRIIPEKELE